jgi:hypothetical protein
MATDKKSFLIYCDIIHTVEQLTDEQAGDLFKHLLRYVNDLNPQSDSVITKIAFEPIRQALKRDLDKYESIRKRNSDNARMRWDATASSGIPNDTKNADSVIDSVIDSDSVIDKKVNKGFIKPTIQEIEIYMAEKGMENLAERFYYFYEAKGWVIGKNKIKDWKSCVMTWKKNSTNNTTTPQVVNRKVFNLQEYDERT